ncbi:hypothetical protein [Alkaliphilus transvaalensis]|uniref:hypothetical protein n=1 Tax=Alkaliphilus transvaalensis TaxID=114628 RepID=UPI000688CFA6|nr:hypothetical protein [Alkaliphilus transvaalensis]
MKKIQLKLLVIAVVSMLIAFEMIDVMAQGTRPPLTANTDLEAFNYDMQHVYNLGTNFFSSNTSRGALNTNIIQQAINANSDRIYLVYGQPHGTILTINEVQLQRYIGYNRFGDNYGNPEFPWDAGWSGVQIQDRVNVKHPWNDTEVRAKHNIRESVFNGIQALYPNGERKDLEELIQTGIDLHYTGKRGRDVLIDPPSHQADRLVYGGEGSKPKTASGGRGLWVDYVHIIQPPTYYSWGYGLTVLDSPPTYYYLEVPIAPFALLDEGDLIARLKNTPTRASEGQRVEVTVEVDSTFSHEVDTIYYWNINGVGNITYSEGGTSQSGRLQINQPSPTNDHRVQLKASFIMPTSDVTVRFRVNNTVGDDPNESNLENNVVEAVIEYHPPQETSSEYDLDYHVLSRKIKHPLANGADITAILQLPQGSWKGAARGNLNVDQASQPEILSLFTVGNNPPVSESSETIIRRPEIGATIERTSFGDDPKGGNYSNLPFVTKNPSISYSGMVDRDYEYEVVEVTGADAEGNPIYTTRKETQTTSASFDNGTDVLNIRTNIYNGLKPQDMPYVAARNFKTVVENNQGTSNIRNMFWISDPYDFDVIRWMCHIDESGNEHNWEEVTGQYQRRFTQQNKGDITWTVLNSMATEYQSDRQAARNMVRDNNRYQKIVFATDRDLQQFNYPVKSGYYLNPAGRYAVTIKTEMYKNTTANTPEHADLVNRIINSFRYQSDLLYTHDGRSTYTVNLSSGNRNIGGHEMLRISQNYTKDYEEIQHSTDRINTGGTHRFWKEILEGYSESNTSNSYNNYKYREHVKSGNIYKVMEETTVIFTVNPNNRRIYTFANMQDSDRYGRDYYIRAWLQDINLNSLSYSGLNIAGKPNQDHTALDSIRITVKGSMFDDLNN